MKKRLLFVFAHPDDESFACAGTMAKYRDVGHDIYLICATSGCGGKSGEYQVNCKQELASLREQELLQACSVLGVSDLYLLRYPDGSLANQDIDEMAEKIEIYILQLMPHVIVTFPPNGVTGHRDHIAISRATEQAVLESEKKLEQSQFCSFFFASIPHYYDYCSDSAPSGAVPITGKVNIIQHREAKGRALQAHRSQIYSVNRAYPGVMQGDYGVIGQYEYYTKVRANGQNVVTQESSDGIPEIELCH
ncbi:PIG-L deacetylase family protein [Paenibacillus sedimenti]|uniref:PIG-L family deacetylase n=1 Tax=Paenibacillus sedimenti TaxID=2770274 RepID=A0A926KUU2_9BACL|nr:PIG-L family deacetylase [Paenibacillus sedimenti]MBD0384450.1 PIG-L family deacetylase [Paenibacillus sedimenti]